MNITLYVKIIAKSEISWVCTSCDASRCRHKKTARNSDTCVLLECRNGGSKCTWAKERCEFSICVFQSTATFFLGPQSNFVDVGGPPYRPQASTAEKLFLTPHGNRHWPYNWPAKSKRKHSPSLKRTQRPRARQKVQAGQPLRLQCAH